MPFAELRAVQSAKSQIVGFLKPRFHCTTLRSVNCLAINAKSPVVLGALMPFAELRAFNRRTAKLFAVLIPVPFAELSAFNRQKAKLLAF